jgi:hypothetical protein
LIAIGIAVEAPCAFTVLGAAVLGAAVLGAAVLGAAVLGAAVLALATRSVPAPGPFSTLVTFKVASDSMITRA